MANELRLTEKMAKVAIEELISKIEAVDVLLKAVEDMPAVGTDLELATVNNLRIEAEKLLFDFENRITFGGRLSYVR